MPAEPPDESAAPPLVARVVAFVAILAAGATGGFIGYAVTDLQCRGDCGTAKGIGALVGALIAAVGVAVVAALALRAMAEWKTIQSTGQTGNWRDERALRKERAAEARNRPPAGSERPRPRVR